MKKLKSHLILPLILTFIFQGCVPDSLTKYSKETPKKATASASSTTTTTTTTTTSTTSTVALDYPTVTTFSYIEADPSVNDLHVGTPATFNVNLSDSISFGSLSDSSKFNDIFLRCALDSISSLPPGMTLNTTNCRISGTPTRPFFDTLGVNYSIGINLYYKSNAAGTEGILTSTINLGSYYYTDNPSTVLTAATSAGGAEDISVSSTNLFPSSGHILIDSEIIAYGAKTLTTFTSITRGGSPVVHAISARVIPSPDTLNGIKDTLAINYPNPVGGFSYTELVIGSPVAITTKDMAVGTAIQFNPKIVSLDPRVAAIDGVGGTLTNPDRAPYIFKSCTLNTSGTLSSRTLPPGLTLNPITCLITGTPTSAYSDTTFGNMGGVVTYTVDLTYKGPTYLGDGTEAKVTALFKLKSHTLTPLENWVAPTTLTYAPSGSTIASSTPTFEIGVAKTYVPILTGTLSQSSKFTDAQVACSVTTGALPSSLTLDPTTCIVGGTATGVPSSTAVSITIAYVDDTGTSRTKVAALTFNVYARLTKLSYNQNDKLQITLNRLTNLVANTDSTNTGDYNTNGLLTLSNGTTGVIKFIDNATSSVSVVRLVPIVVSDSSTFSVNDFIYSSLNQFGVAFGKVVKIDDTSNTLYVERTDPVYNINATIATIRNSATASTYNALAGVTPVAVDTTSLDPSYIFNPSITDIDNNSDFYAANYTQSKVTLVYEKGTVNSVSLLPLATGQTNAFNGVTYTISPSLPAGLTWTPSTGAITGKFNNTMVPTKFTITATNSLGSISTFLYLSAIETPKDLSYTTRELVTVNSFASLNEGETLFQPLTAPINKSISGQLLRKYGTNQISIATSNGQFLKGASLDSGNAYYSEKTTVSSTVDPIYYNIALIVSAAGSFSASTSTTNQYVWSEDGAAGRIVAIIGSTLFIQYLNNSGNISFVQGKHIATGIAFLDTAAGRSAAASSVGVGMGIPTITEVEADNMKMTLSTAGVIKVGDELSTHYTGTEGLATANSIGGYINKFSVSDKVAYVSDIGRNESHLAYFQNGTSYRATEKYSSTAGIASTNGTIGSVSNDNFFIVERGNIAEIKSNVSLGNGAYYSISPALPSGLSLNSSTGMITGTPTVSSPRTTYTITAQNLVNVTTFVMDLESRDYFSLSENSGARSTIFHKYGDARGSRKCRVNATDIINHSLGSSSVNAATLDVRCIIDMEEQDLFTNNLKLLSSAGSGACEYIQVIPFSFWQYAPAQTATTDYNYYTGNCVSGGHSNNVARVCLGDYTSVGGPNCDETSFNLITHTRVDAGGGICNDTTSTTVVSCGGKKLNCLRGPVRDILSDGQILAGSSSLVYSSASGTTITTEFKSPSSNSYLTNLSVANNTVTNSCTMSNADVESWSTFQATLSSTDNPFAKGSNPYYTVNCLDSSRNVKARIRIAVREWNSSFKIKDNIDYDVPLSTGTVNLMNASGSYLGQDTNAYSDWDDAYNVTAAAGGSCTSSPSPNYLFPADKL